MSDSVTRWWREAKSGDDVAMARVWNHCRGFVFSIAMAHLRGVSRAVCDEEDVIVSVFDTVFRGAVAGTLPELHDRQDLKDLLAVVTIRKAINRVRYLHRKKRFPGTVDSSPITLEELAGNISPPDMHAIAVETCREMFDSLKDETLVRVVVLRMEGYQNQEIADQLNCALRTVERKLERIRRIWRQFDQP